MGGVVMLVVGRVCMPYVVRSVEKRNGTKDAEELKKRLRVQVSNNYVLGRWCEYNALCRWH